MNKINVFDMPREERVVESKSFTTASGQTIFLKLQEPGAPEMAQAAEIAQELVETYITGSEIREAAPFPVAGIRVTKTIFLTCALLEVMQVERTYTALEFVILSDRAGSVWPSLQNWAQQLMNSAGDKQGKSPGAPTASSAARRSTTTSSTRKSPIAGTTSSEPSRIELAVSSKLVGTP